MTRNERGVAMAEYLPLLAVIALILVVAYAMFGEAVRETLAGECRGERGGFEQTMVWDADDKKGAVDANKNGNLTVCVKDEANDGRGLPGEGNTGNNNNVKDDS